MEERVAFSQEPREPLVHQQPAQPPILRPARDTLPSFVLEFEPWQKSLLRQIRELFPPPKLPPLKLTSKPVAVKDLWGDYRYGKVAGSTSGVLHVLLLVALIVVPFGKQVGE